jgi:hypothetical protein
MLPPFAYVGSVMLSQAGGGAFKNYWKNQVVGHHIVSMAKGIPFA